MLQAAVTAGVVGTIILLLRSLDQVKHRFATGVLAAAIVGLLFVPWIGEQTVDPALQFMGANTADIAENVLTVFACYVWVAASRTPGTGRRLWAWRGFCFTVAAALIVTYVFSPQFHPPAVEFPVRGTITIAHDWLLVAFLLLAGVLIVYGAVASWAEGVTLPLTLLMYGVLGAALAGAGIMIGVQLITDPSSLRAHFDSLAQIYAAVGLSALAVACVPVLIEGWRDRRDPR